MDYRLHRSLPLALNIAVGIAIVQIGHDRQHRRKLQWVAISESTNSSGFLRFTLLTYLPTYLLTYSDPLNTFSNFS